MSVRTITEGKRAARRATRILNRRNGVDRLLDFVRDGRIDVRSAVDAIARHERRPITRIRRVLLALGDALFYE